MQDEIQKWTMWTKHKVMQVTDRLAKVHAEFKTLSKKKQEVELLKKDKEVLEDNADKRIYEMENAIENMKKQGESATSTMVMLEEERSLLKKGLEAAKMLVVNSMASYQQALEREKMAVKQIRSWESEKVLLQDELEREKQKLSNHQKELDKEKNLQAKVEVCDIE
jgi:chromosome segregation ATPase